MLDNVLLRGRVLDPDDDAARAMATLNDSLAGDERVDVAMLAVSDGVTLLRRR
jgi:caffeoyl-CoA O-methyltransferase